MLMRLLPLLLVAVAIVPARTAGRVEAAAESQPSRISETGGVESPAIAFNPAANEYLVVWNAPDPSAGVIRVFGQRVDTATGNEIGPNDFAISGTDTAAGAPAVAYNSQSGEFLVVWNAAGRNLGRRVAADGSLPGTQFQIGDLTLNVPPGLAYNATTGEYLVTRPFYQTYRYCDGTWDPFPPPGRCSRWAQGTNQSIVTDRLDGSGVSQGRTYVAGRSTLTFLDPVVVGRSNVIWNSLANEYLIAYTLYETPYAARLAGDSASIIGQAFTLTTAGGTPSLAYNANRNEYLAVWPSADHVYGQLLRAAGVQIGPDDFRIDSRSGNSPSVAYDSRRDEYFVTWDDNGVRGRRLSATGAATGSGEFQLLPDGYASRSSAVAHNPTAREYFVAMASSAPFLAAGRSEVFGARYAAPTPFLVGLARGGSGEAQSWEIGTSGVTQGTSLQLPWPTYNDVNGELHPAVGDIDGDGLNEMVIGLGSGGDGWIAIFDDAAHGHALLTWVQLPWPSYNSSNGTIWPAVGDVDGDGKSEIVAGLGSGGQGYYAIFDDASRGYALLSWRRVNWSWYNTTQSGETRPAVANMDGGSFSEIVIGLGPGGAGWLEVVDDAEAGYAHLRWLRVGWGAYTSGAGETFPAAGDVDGDGYDEIVVGLGPNSQGWLQVFDDAFQGLVHRGWLQVSWSAYANTNGETHPAVGDIDGDAAHEIVLGLGVFPGQGGWFEIRDDFTTSFASLGWRNVGRGDFYAAGGATFPAIGRIP